MTLSESTRMFEDNLVKVTTHVIKHLPSVNFGENGNDTNGMKIFDIEFALPLIYRMSPFFSSEGIRLTKLSSS